MGIMGLIIMTLVALNYFSEPGPPTLRPLDAPDTIRITYKVEGGQDNCDFSITYTNREGGTSQEDAHGNWDRSFTVERDTRLFLYISAQRTCEVSGPVDVSILINGVRFRTSHSYGKFVIATASSN